MGVQGVSWGEGRQCVSIFVIVPYMVIVPCMEVWVGLVGGDGA